MIDAVRRYDGYVVQSTGDGIFALFGAPVAHEDHPKRALYAALRMQEELRRYSAKLVTEGGMPLEARIGVNTGEVVVRSLATGGEHAEYTPIGHTTNLASRMQAVAPTGSIAISEATRKLAEGYFVLKPLGATRIKGVSEPVDVYEVTGLGPLRTRLQRAVGRGLTKFVGREREMEALKHAAELAQQGHGQIATAVAEAGVGKSRLFHEFKARHTAGWMVLEAFTVSHGKGSSYLPVIDLLHSYFKIASQDDQRTRREKVVGRIAILDHTLEGAIPYLYSLLGIADQPDPLAQMDAQTRRRGTLDAIKRILLRESLKSPPARQPMDSPPMLQRGNSRCANRKRACDKCQDDGRARLRSHSDRLPDRAMQLWVPVPGTRCSGSLATIVLRKIDAAGRGPGPYIRGSVCQPRLHVALSVELALE
jgi:hypothetical protein